MTARNSPRATGSRPPGDPSDLVFRTSPDWDLLVFDRLSPPERRAVGEQIEDPNLYGVLRRQDGGAIKVIDRDLALLLFTLEHPGSLPRFLRRELEPEPLRRWVRGLVADGVLELAHQGGFLRRAEALDVLGDGDRGPQTGSRLQRLALTALEHASAMPAASRARRARCLYEFNGRPLTPSWQARLPDETAVGGWLGLDGENGARWDLRGQRSTTGSWTAWSAGRGEREGRGPDFKLYVSPLPEDLPAAVELLAASQASMPASHWKIARSLDAVLRPDKLMLYFNDFDALSEAAELLSRRLSGLRPQGVPFTADIGLDGLLSWGADPPASRHLASWRPRASWRSWITDRLAEAICDAFDHCPAEPWRLALDTLALEGVDTATWSPDPIRWSVGDP